MRQWIHLYWKVFEEWSGAALPAVLPQELVKLRGRDLQIIVCTHCELLLTHWSISKIYCIEQEVEELIIDYWSEENFKKSLYECNCSVGFKDGWSYTGVCFPVLRDFCGGLAAIFPGTATVDINLYIVKHVKNDFRTSPTQFLLEGILHANQFRLLQDIDTK